MITRVGLFIALLSPATPAVAHPTATTDVRIAIGARTVDVTVTSDAEALRVKLAALQRSLVDCIDLRVDGVSATLQIVDRAAVTPGREAIHLRAAIPEGAARVMWSWSLVMGSYPVVVHRAGAADVTDWLQGSESTAPYAIGAVAVRASLASRVRQYMLLGFTHIVPNGFDHILFVLGLFLLTTNLRSVLAQVTAFTVAHSITLGLTVYGVVSLPAGVVEPMIALSIGYVAVENLMTSELKPWRLLLVFGFGLVHGMGFAEALSRLQLQRSDFLTTLVCFNVGVEAGQLTIIAAAWSLAALWALPAPRYRRFIVVPASICIAAIGAIWTIQRLF